MKQKSLFPDELADVTIPLPKRKVRWRKKLFHFLWKEGFYKYAVMAESMLAMEEQYIRDKYKMSKAELAGTLESVFGENCLYQETITSFLYRTRTESAFSLTHISGETDKMRKRRKRN